MTRKLWRDLVNRWLHLNLTAGDRRYREQWHHGDTASHRDRSSGRSLRERW